MKKKGEGGGTTRRGTCAMLIGGEGGRAPFGKSAPSPLRSREEEAAAAAAALVRAPLMLSLARPLPPIFRQVLEITLDER